MMNIEIRAVETHKDLKKFIDLPYKLYSDQKYWIPPIKREVFHLFNEKKNPFWEHAEKKLFIAISGKAVLGRIAAILDHNYIQFHDAKIGHFGFFECIDDASVAKKLYKAAEDFLRDRGMLEINGPMNPCTNEECGFLLEGFDDYPRLMMTYTPEYYLGLSEAAGYVKKKDLLAYHMKVQQPLPEKVARLYGRIMERNNIKLSHLDIKNFDKELIKIKEIYNSAWERNWGFVPMTEAEKDKMANDLKTLIVPELLQFAEIDGETVAWMWTMPDYNHVLKKMKGRMNPIIFLKERKKIKWARVITFGIKESYRGRGIDAVFFHDALETVKKMGFTDAEFSWILEDNVMVNRAAVAMGGEIYKKYRIYGKKLKG